MGDVNQIAFVVTCKGRLHHLRQTLPLLVSQADCECIVVDYDCPDQTYRWVTTNFPTVHVVHVSDAPRFHLARARNLGAAIASARWLCFVDADILIDSGFATALTRHLQEGFYYRPLPMSWEKWGSHLCPRASFQRIEGYDEAIEGWGGEDDDLYRRLESIGCQPASFPGQLLTSIQHDDLERTLYYDIQDKWTNQRINALYLQLKYDISRLLPLVQLTLAERQTIYAEVRRTLLQDVARRSSVTHFEVTLPDGAEIPLAPGWSMRRRLVFDLITQHENRQSNAVENLIDIYFASQTVHKLHIGCGDHVLEGWLNTDLHPRQPCILAMDASQALPFADNSFDFIFSEHVIEHLPFPQGCNLLAECHRTLKTGGVLRLATPDLAFLLGLYSTTKSEIQQAFLDWSKDCFLPWAPSSEDTFVINNSVRDWGHHFIYDEKVLRKALEQVGFTLIMRQELMESGIAELRQLENESRSPPGLLKAETMVFEAVKA